MSNINEIINSILNHEESNKILKTLLDTHKYDSEVKTHLKKINLKKINNNDDYSHSKYSKYTKYIKFIDVEKRDVWEREGCYYVFDIKIEIILNSMSHLNYISFFITNDANITVFSNQNDSMVIFLYFFMLNI